MTANPNVETFTRAACAVGAEVIHLTDLSQAVESIRELARGPVILPSFPSGERLELGARLKAAGLELIQNDIRGRAAQSSLGVTGANFALAATGTVVLESTPEPIRLATTLPERHVVLLDPNKILSDDLDAVPVLRRFHQNQPRNFLAYITGPSRTADIERVLTIGVHGPKQLTILLLEGQSEDPPEMERPFLSVPQDP